MRLTHGSISDYVLGGWNCLRPTCRSPSRTRLNWVFERETGHFRRGVIATACWKKLEPYPLSSLAELSDEGDDVTLFSRNELTTDDCLTPSDAGVE